MKSQKSSTICAVLVGADPADAGRAALADVAEQAGPADLAGPLEHAGRAGAGREHPQQQVERLADRPGVRVRAEVAHALALGAAHHLQPRVLLVQRHRQRRVGLVVAVADVEPRVELLDPGVLELQRLDLGAHDRPLDARRGGDHLPGARVQRGDVGEVGVQPLPQALRLADVDDPAALVAEPVDARARAGSCPARGGTSTGRARFEVSAPKRHLDSSRVPYAVAFLSDLPEGVYAEERRDRSGRPAAAGRGAARRCATRSAVRSSCPATTASSRRARVWNRAIGRRRPAVVVGCARTADVAAAVRFARAAGLPLAVRGGGFAPAGVASCPGGVVVDTRPMNVGQRRPGRPAPPSSAPVRPGARSTPRPSGSAWSSRACRCAGIGVAGSTIGGGYGHLRRAYGLACDNLISAELVAADGSHGGGHRRPEPGAAVGAARRRRQLRRAHVARLPAPAAARPGDVRRPGLPGRARRSTLLRFYRDYTATLRDDVSTRLVLIGERHSAVVADTVGAPDARPGRGDLGGLRRSPGRGGRARAADARRGAGAVRPAHRPAVHRPAGRRRPGLSGRPARGRRLALPRRPGRGGDRGDLRELRGDAGELLRPARGPHGRQGGPGGADVDRGPEPRGAVSGQHDGALAGGRGRRRPPAPGTRPPTRAWTSTRSAARTSG